jgi:hypothetical protein
MKGNQGNAFKELLLLPSSMKDKKEVVRGKDFLNGVRRSRD